MISIRLRSVEHLWWSLTIIGSYIPTPHRAIPPDAVVRARTARVERLHPTIEHNLVVLGKSKPHIGFAFSRHISRMQSYRDNCLVITSYFVILNPLQVLLISCLVACSARLDSYTHSHTHTHTDQLP